MVGQPASGKTLNFLIGPQFQGVQTETAVDVFSPTVHIKQADGTLKAYKLLVFQGHRCLVTLLFNEADFKPTYKQLDSLNSFLTVHVPAVS